MKQAILIFAALLLAALNQYAADAGAPFTGRIEATVVRGVETQSIIYTANTNCLRIERGETNLPYACNLVDRVTGAVTLLFPHNRSYVELTNRAASPAPAGPGMPVMPQMPAGIGPQPGVAPWPANTGPPNAPRMFPMPAPPATPTVPAMPPSPAGGTMPNMPPMPQAGGGMPMMPMMPTPGAPLELAATGDTTNLLGCSCRRYELKQQGEIMEIWAAQTNLPFAQYLPSQPPRFGSHTIEEQWAGLVAAQKLFPLRAILKFENGPERWRYEVKSIVPQNPDEQSVELFRPPPEYRRIEPLPF